MVSGKEQAKNQVQSWPSPTSNVTSDKIPSIPESQGLHF